MIQSTSILLVCTDLIEYKYLHSSCMTTIYSCILIAIYSFTPMYMHVHSCTLMYINPCILVCTHGYVYPFTLMYVYSSCKVLCTCAHHCDPFTLVYTYGKVHSYTHAHPCTFMYSTLLLTHGQHTHVRPCTLKYTYVQPRSNMPYRGKHW